MKNRQLFPRKRAIQLLLATLVAMLLLPVTSARAQDAAQSFVRESASTQQQWSTQQPHELRRARVQLNARLLQQNSKVEGETLSFNFFDDVSPKGVIARTVAENNETLRLRGKLQETRYGNFVLSRQDGRFFGRVRVPSQSTEYTIHYDEELNSHVVVEEDLSQKEREQCETSDSQSSTPDRIQAPDVGPIFCTTWAANLR